MIEVIRRRNDHVCEASEQCASGLVLSFKNKGVSIWKKMDMLCLVTQLCLILCDPHGLWPARILCPWDSPGKNTRMGCHALCQGIFPTYGLNPGLPQRKQILYCLSNQGSPRILEWVVYPFSRRTSQPRNSTRVSCITGRFFTSPATRKQPTSKKKKKNIYIYITLMDLMSFSTFRN